MRKISFVLPALLGIVLSMVSCHPSEKASPASGHTSAEQSMVRQVEAVPLVSAEALNDMLQNKEIVLLDTRSIPEYQAGHLEGARFVNFQTFRLEDVQDIAKDANVVVYCKSGGRSNQVGLQLKAAGYQKVRNLKGGIVQWKKQGYPIIND